MNEIPEIPSAVNKRKHLKTFAVIFTIFGVLLFVYFVYSVGITEIIEGVEKIGIAGFALIVFLYLLRIIVRAIAWKLSVSNPHQLSFNDTFQAVIIGEAVSSIIPLGILASGTSKAVAVSNRIPLVAGLSSVATENLFYTLVTGIFIICGAIAFLFGVEVESIWLIPVFGVIGFISALITFGFLAIIKQWHLVSGLLEFFYKRNILRGILENLRVQALEFEHLIFDFYRQKSANFLPIIVCEILYHVIGVTEVWFILSKISEVMPTLYSSFLLESVSRVVTITFKLIPFAIGVDEASSQFITENLSLGVAVGVTIAILRKGRILFWAICGMLLILKREISLTHLLNHKQ
jgi:Lysylphosphatidylglycerol synthase TM region